MHKAQQGQQKAGSNPMTLIQRQDALVAKLERIYLSVMREGHISMDGMAIGQRSKAKRLHAEEMMAAGYSRGEAWQSANDCDQVAQVNASHAAFLAQMGAAS